MAHFCRIDENNEVQEVIVIPNFTENEEDNGKEYILNRLKLEGVWLQTSYNGNIRNRFAGIGMLYDSTLDAFIDKQPFPSWTLDEEKNWVPPSPYPQESLENHIWDEDTLAWVVEAVEQAQEF